MLSQRRILTTLGIDLAVRDRLILLPIAFRIFQAFRFHLHREAQGPGPSAPVVKDSDRVLSAGLGSITLLT